MNPSVGRVLVYGVLLLAAAFFLLPLYVMLVTSFKDAEEIRTTCCCPARSLNFEPGPPPGPPPARAWTAGACKPFFWNSVAMAVPAVLISTAVGGAQRLRAEPVEVQRQRPAVWLLLFGVFMPFQVVLLPMSQVLGWLGCPARSPGWCWCTAWRGWPAPRCSSATTTPPFRRSW
jgi:glucose/mannose transport system permease protein